ncbi:nucleotidyl transferase AbiEii/AbiGii toxin family protein [Archangium sp.]|uniref:nucleotidyl transferase AbiEii/AbiGii toxin family protein n=1 Tax=Archangium sp. TaxID=1872627 RepID=UPI00389B1F8F
MSIRQYKTPSAFKQALEDRLKDASRTSGRPLDRIRQQLVFDRFLTRVFTILGEAVVLKGGVVLELRLARARSTKDVDLRCAGNPNLLLAQLREAGQLDMGDHLLFEVAVGPHGDVIDGEGMVYEGRRFRVQGRLADKPYGHPFGVDAAFGDVLVGTPEVIAGSDVLAFAGVPRSSLRVYPRETHVAEKLHAYTLPRQRENSRVKDLPDLALLAQTGTFSRGLLRTALEKTFSFRGSHLLMEKLPPPPASWLSAYEYIARNDRLPWNTLADVYRAASAFLDPVLKSGGETWSPDRWRWE